MGADFVCSTLMVFSSGRFTRDLSSHLARIFEQSCQGFPESCHSSSIYHWRKLCWNIHSNYTPVLLVSVLIASTGQPYILKAHFESPNSPVTIAKIAIGDGSVGSGPEFQDLPAVSVIV